MFNYSKLKFFAIFYKMNNGKSMEFWQNIYSNFDVVAFSVLGFKVHWYGIMYVLALLLALLLAKFFVRKFKLDIDEKRLDSYFIWWKLA